MEDKRDRPEDTERVFISAVVIGGKQGGINPFRLRSSTGGVLLAFRMIVHGKGPYVLSMAKFFCYKPQQKPQHPRKVTQAVSCVCPSGCGCPNWLVVLGELGKGCSNHLSKARM